MYACRRVKRIKNMYELHCSRCKNWSHVIRKETKVHEKSNIEEKDDDLVQQVPSMWNLLRINVDREGFMYTEQD